MPIKYPEDFIYSGWDRIKQRPKDMADIQGEQTEELHKIRMLLEMIVERMLKD